MQYLLIILFIPTVLIIMNIYSQEICQFGSKLKLSVRGKGDSKILSIKVTHKATSNSPTLIVTLPLNTKVTGIKMEEGMSVPYQIVSNQDSKITSKLDSYIEFDLKDFKKDFRAKISIVPIRNCFLKNSNATAFFTGRSVLSTNNYAMYKIS